VNFPVAVFLPTIMLIWRPAVVAFPDMMMMSDDDIDM
jgi:hypothetical protein